MDSVKNRFRREVERLVDRFHALADGRLADRRDGLNQVCEDYYAAYVSCAEEDVRRTYFASVEDRRNTFVGVRFQAERAGMTPREWFVTWVSAHWARKAASVTSSFLILNEALEQPRHVEAQRRVRIRLRELYEESDEALPIRYAARVAQASGLGAVLAWQGSAPTPPSLTSSISASAASGPPTGLGAVLAWQGSAPTLPSPTGSVSVYAASGPDLEGAVFGQSVALESNDAVPKLRKDLQNALVTYSADKLSQFSAGEINNLGVDGETIRRIANGTTRKPRVDTVRQLRQTLTKLQTLEKANQGEREQNE